MKRGLKEKIQDLLNYKIHEKNRLQDAIHEASLKSDWDTAHQSTIRMRAIDRFIHELQQALN